MNKLYRLWIIIPVFSFISCVSGVSSEEAARVYYNLGYAYQELEKEQEAVRAYTRAWELNPRLFQAGYNLARLKIEAGRPADARKSLEELLLEDKTNTLLLELLAWSHVVEGEEGKAREIYEDLLSLDPGHDRVIHNLAILYEKEERWADARDAYKRLYTLPSYSYVKDSSHEFLLRCSLLDLKLNNRDEAVRNLEYLLEEFPDIRGIEALGRVYQEDRLFGRALEVYQKGLDLSWEQPDRDGELHKKILGEKAFILLTVVEDEVQGMAALEEAVEAGAADFDFFERLLEGEGFLFADQVTDLRIRKEIVAPEKSGEPSPSIDGDREEPALPPELPPLEG